jgi:hypothetical protein
MHTSPKATNSLLINKPNFEKEAHLSWTIELSITYSKESSKTLCLLKTGNKVVEVG